MNNYQISFELAQTIGRDRQVEAEKHRLLRQVQAGRPGVFNPLGSQIGALLVALALALRLRGRDMIALPGGAKYGQR